jgi:hypothetical protein
VVLGAETIANIQMAKGSAFTCAFKKKITTLMASRQKIQLRTVSKRQSKCTQTKQWNQRFSDYMYVFELGLALLTVKSDPGV